MASSLDKAGEISPVSCEPSGTSGIELGVEAEPAALRDGPALGSEEEEVDPISSALRETPFELDDAADRPDCVGWVLVERPRLRCDFGLAGASLKMLEYGMKALCSCPGRTENLGKT